MIPYSRPKLSDLYTLSQRKVLENHTLHSGTYLYSPYMAVPPPPSPGKARCNFAGLLSLQSTHLRDFRNFRKVMAALMQRLDVDLEKCYENDLDWTL